MDLFRLDSKVALVTGGAGQYGLPISTALAEAGAKVIIAARDLARCEQAAQELRSQGLDVIAMKLDLSEEASILELKDQILGECGKLDILFNNAVAREGGAVDKQTREQWDFTMKVNSTGLFLSSKIFGNEMAKRRTGTIVNIASIYGVVGPHFAFYEGTEIKQPADYAFSKGGMISLTRYLASFYAQFNVRVNCISPGGYYTGTQPQSFLKAYYQHTPLGRMANDDDIKGCAVFLASEAASYVTGHNLLVDGGWTAI